MLNYLARRLLMMIPTLFGITTLSFIIINLAPGSPIEQKLMEIQMAGAASGTGSAVSQDVINALNKQWGFDQPVHVRYGLWLRHLAVLDFGDSFKYEEPVTSVIASKLPVSLLFGSISFILSYLICIPLGVAKAIHHGSRFDRATSFLLFVTYSIPPLILGILLLVFFAGASYFDWFPISGVISDNHSSLGAWDRFTDRLHHAVLPSICYMIGSFTFLTMMMKSSMLDVVRLDYIRTAKAKGLDDWSVFMKHALRNALIPVITGMSDILSLFFTGSIIIEMIFNIDGMGLLTFTAVGSRDYNVLMGLIFLQSMMFLFARVLTDVLYVVVDPRIDFA